MSRGSIRVNCRGVIIGCNECKDEELKEGFCTWCGRPLNKCIGDKCGIVYAYVERGYVWKGAIKVKCRYCKTINKI